MATAVFLCALPISCGSNFLPARRRVTAEGGSSQRIPSHRCLALRSSHLSRFQFSAGPKAVNRRGRKFAENTEPPLFSSARFYSLRSFSGNRRRGTQNQPARLRGFGIDRLQPLFEFSAEVVGLRQSGEVAHDLSLLDKDQGR